MLNIDQFAYASKLKQQDPREKLFFAFLTLGVCLWANSALVSLLIICIMGWVTVCKGGTPLPVFLKLLAVPMSFLLIGLLTIAVEFSGDPRPFILWAPVFGKYLGITNAGIHTAAVLFFKALGAVSCLYYLSLNTPLVDLLSALGKLKCPKLLTELMGLMYRFIFILLETVETMLTAQQARLGYSGISAGYRSLGALVSTLFIQAYKRADELYTALEARGYEGGLNVLGETFRTRWTGYFVPVAVNIFLVFAALLLR